MEGKTQHVGRVTKLELLARPSKGVPRVERPGPGKSMLWLWLGWTPFSRLRNLLPC